MKINKCSKHAFNMVLHSKLRSWLTAFQGRRGATQTESVFPTYLWYILGIVVVFVGVVVQRKYKSQKLLDPDFKLKDIFKNQKK